MRAKVQCLYERGRALTKQQRSAMPTYQGELRFHEARSQHLGRITPSAKLVSTVDGTESEVVPDLYDAAVVFMRNRTIRVRGFEMRDGIVYAQTWDVEVN